MLRKEWFRFKKLRVLLAWIGAPLLFFFSHISTASFFWGTLLMALGELIRLWSLGFMEKKGKELAMRGPYALSRNPLYIGNFFLGLGLMVVCSSWVIGIVFLIGYPIVYLGTIRQEEKILLERFGKTYEEYCKNVPRLFPRLSPYAAPSGADFDWKRVLRHHEYVTALGIALLLCGIHLYDMLYLQKAPLASQTGWIVTVSLLALALILERLFISDFNKMFAEGMPNLFHKK